MRCLILVLTLAFVACSAFGSSDGRQDVDAGVLDASVSEAAADGGAADGGAADGGAADGGAPDAPGAVVGCDPAPCTGGSFCCIHGRASEPIECIAPQGSCADPLGARAYCDDTTDCPSGDVCCLHFATVWGDLASCVTSASCPADDSHNRMCDPANPGECGAGSCVALSDARPSYVWRLPAFVCKP